MIKSCRKISGERFEVNCAEQFQPQAERLLDMLETIVRKRGSDFLDDGSTIQMGWSLLRIRRIGDVLVVEEPNFSGNPFLETRPDLTYSLWVQAEQNAVLKALYIEGEPVGFQDKVQYYKGALESYHIYLERNPPTKGDSGWCIGEVNELPVEPHEVFVYQLLASRPAIMKVLALPRGITVRFNDDRVVAIHDHNNIPFVLNGIE